MKSLEESITRFLPPHMRGRFVDAVFIFLNLLVLPFLDLGIGGLFWESKETGSEPIVLLVILFAALAARFIGLYLKRFSLQLRNKAQSNLEATFPFAMVGAGVMGLTALLILNGFLAWLYSSGIVETRINDAFNTSLKAVPVGLALLEAGFFYFWLRLPLDQETKENKKLRDWRFSPATELFADIGLLFYMFVWQAFYNYFVVTSLARIESTETFLESLLMMGIAFLFFYLPPRIIFTLEESKDNYSILRIFLVFASVIIGNLLWIGIFGW